MQSKKNSTEGKVKPLDKESKIAAVAQMAEERRKERVKALTRNLEVCDLLDMRNV